ncbi:aspartate racemase [Rubritalea squalenifaciens DSM 18772]|uniref:Aspartate racemase n=1 Tax=Rubritalea squalenifaciens DSM 18772 TaxID=1123071 RepID=A0A1M6NKA1_9BACT|nr:amino acid racemase [Rubritalea squalenifaciens]SHJ96141.1 aspartate racemase [Rubritalea squalenifaciens DSM 18772]
MKTLGLIGGTSWHSTVEYYSTLNRAINQHYGNNTNPPLHLVSLNQHEIHELQRSGDWQTISTIFIDAAQKLARSGCDAIALCANTPHKIYEPLQESLNIPVLHIADAIADSVKAQDLDCIGLLGTRFTMQEDFIRGRLLSQHQITSLVPAPTEQDIIQQHFYDKLSMGIFDDESRAAFLKIIEKLATKGAKAVVLGCTEFPILLRDSQSQLPLIDSLQSHCHNLTQYLLD